MLRCFNCYLNIVTGNELGSMINVNLTSDITHFRIGYIINYLDTANRY